MFSFLLLFLPQLLEFGGQFAGEIVDRLKIWAVFRIVVDRLRPSENTWLVVLIEVPELVFARTYERFRHLVPGLDELFFVDDE